MIGLTISGIFSEAFRDWLIGYGSGGAAIRNVGLIIAALTALPVAIWRGIVADKQSAASRRQADTAQRGLRNERYQRSVEMLGSEVLSVRLGGIYALQLLAKEDPEEYHIQIMGIFCAFARQPTKDEGHENELFAKMGYARIRDDVEAVMRAIRDRPESSVELEFSSRFEIDLRGANLQQLFHDYVSKAGHSYSLVHADLSSAKLFKADFVGADLSRADLSGADLDSARFFRHASLEDTILDDANISGAEFSGRFTGLIGLTQERLDQARAWPDEPPILEDVRDHEGNELVWRGGRGEPLIGQE